MDASDFMLEVVSFMDSLGISVLEGSGLRFPAVDWDWADCCHACAWLGYMGHELPGNLLARMVLGPMDPVASLYFRWLRHKSGRPGVVDIFDLAG